LKRDRTTARQVWEMVGKLVNNAAESFLAIDGSVQNKQHSKSTGLVKKQCSGAVGGLVRGIGVVNLVHGDGQEHRPIGHRIHDNTAGGKTNARTGRWERPFQGRADQRGCGQRHPAKTVPFDGWCAAWGNLQLANPLKLAFHATRLVGLTKEGGYVHPQRNRVDARTAQGRCCRQTECPHGALEKCLSRSSRSSWLPKTAALAGPPPMGLMKTPPHRPLKMRTACVGRPNGSTAESSG